VGVYAGYVSETVISHNEIGHTPYTGLSVGWGWGSTPSYMQNNQLSYNSIHHNMQVLGDGGCIYS